MALCTTVINQNSTTSQTTMFSGWQHDGSLFQSGCSLSSDALLTEAPWLLSRLQVNKLQGVSSKPLRLVQCRTHRSMAILCPELCTFISICGLARTCIYIFMLFRLVHRHRSQTACCSTRCLMVSCLICALSYVCNIAHSLNYYFCDSLVEGCFIFLLPFENFYSWNL